MTDMQLLTLAIAVIVPLSLLICTNSRISDVNNRITDLRGSVGEAKETLRAEMRAQNAELRSALKEQIAEIRALMERNHSELLAKFAEMDNRLARLESERRIVP